MKKNYMFLMFTIIMFVLPMVANAECSYSEKVRLQKLAGNVSFSYNYIETDSGVTFDVIVSNLTNELYMVDYSTGQTYYSNNEDFVIRGYDHGKSIRFDFYVKDKTCSETSIFSNYVTLPSYNYYYKKEICEGLEDYKLCQKWVKINMTYEQFKEEIKKYKNKNNITQDEQTLIDSFNWDIVVEFWAKYYIYILVGIIALCGVTMYIYDKKSEL